MQAVAIVIAAGMIGAVILYTERYQVWHDAATFYVMHDTWSGELTTCRVRKLDAPEAILSMDCSRMASTMR